MPPETPSVTLPSVFIKKTLPRSLEVAPSLPRIPLLGVHFHALRRTEVIDQVEHFIAEHTPRQICLSNAYTVALAQRDSDLQDLLNQADLLLPDGMSIVWGAAWIGLKLPERVAGPDLMSALCALASEKGYRVFLLGSSPGNLQRLKDVLLLRWPDLTVAGVYSPSMCGRIGEPENEQILQQLKNARPDILFVGMSCPKQEKWIADNVDRLGVPVSLGVGAAFDFLSGRIPRAPLYFQRLGLEWLHRLMCEPRRLWKRYLLGNAIFLTLLAGEWFKIKGSRWTRRRPSSA